MKSFRKRKKKLKEKSRTFFFDFFYFYNLNVTLLALKKKLSLKTKKITQNIQNMPWVILPLKLGLYTFWYETFIHIDKNHLFRKVDFVYKTHFVYHFIQLSCHLVKIRL